MQLAQEEIYEIIERRLRNHFEDAAVGTISDAVIRGQVVRLPTQPAVGIVAYKRGVLFVAGREYVISDD